MNVRRILPEEYKRCQELWTLCFEFRMKGPDKTSRELLDDLKSNPRTREDLCWDNRWVAFDDDGAMMSVLGVIPWEARFDGHTVRMDGVGGVATRPEYRRRGAVRACFEAALPAMRREGALLSYLYPFSTDFYRKFGYAMGCDWTLWKLALAGLPEAKLDGRWRLIEKGMDVVDDLRAVDAARQGRYNLMVVDGDIEYRWAGEVNPYAHREYSYLYYGADGAPRGYISWVPATDADGDSVLDVKRLGYVDREGLLAMLTLMRRLAADHSHALLRLPCDVSLKGVLPEWRLGRVRRTVETRGMVRAVNVEGLLRIARTRGSGRLTVAVEDPVIPENDGTFQVTFDGAGTNDVRRTDRAPDVRMTIQAFSRMICGLEDGVDPQWQPGVTLLGDRREAEKLFFRKPCFIERYF